MARYKSTRSDIVLGAIILLALSIATGVIEEVYAKHSYSRVDRSQAHYQAIHATEELKEAELKFMAELGRNNQLSTTLEASNGFRMLTKNFWVGSYWPREVGWHVYSKRKATIRLLFPPHAATHAAFFLTDGTSFTRISKITVGEQVQLADDLHNGRWIVFPLTEEDVARGMVDAKFQKLMGDSVAVSAAALLNVSAKGKTRDVRDRK